MDEYATREYVYRECSFLFLVRHSLNASLSSSLIVDHDLYTQEEIIVINYFLLRSMQRGTLIIKKKKSNTDIKYSATNYKIKSYNIDKLFSYLLMCIVFFCKLIVHFPRHKPYCPPFSVILYRHFPMTVSGFEPGSLERLWSYLNYFATGAVNTQHVVFTCS